MKINEIANVLSEVSVFNGMEASDLLMLGEYFRAEPHAAGEVIFREGDRVKDLFVVVSGNVEVMLPKSAPGLQRFTAVKLANFGPGECFGEYSLVDLRPATATATVKQDAELLKISRTDLDQVLNRNCHIARQFYYNLALLLVDRLRRHNEELDLFTFS
jgi:CRP-like cAMP-binding protein